MDYMRGQRELNPAMRTILVNWMHDICRHFGMSQDTWFLAVNMVDRFLAKKSVSKSRLPLVGTGALFVASKFEDVYGPTSEELSEMTDKVFEAEEILQMECILLNTLEFDLVVETPLTFVRPEDHMTLFLVELSLLHYEMLQWTPAETVQAAEFFTKPDVPAGRLAECLLAIKDVLRRTRFRTEHNESVYKKYSKQGVVQKAMKFLAK